MNARLLDGFKTLVATTKEGSRTLSELIRASAKASAQSTSTLMGVVGGFVGMAVAYSLTFAAPISLPIVGPICSGLGIVLAILVHRGKSRIVFERKLEQNRIAAEEIMGRIKSLPRNAPQHVRDELWDTYKALNSMTTIAKTAALVLPPPTAPLTISGSSAPTKPIPASRGTPEV